MGCVHVNVHVHVHVKVLLRRAWQPPGGSWPAWGREQDARSMLVPTALLHGDPGALVPPH